MFSRDVLFYLFWWGGVDFKMEVENYEVDSLTFDGFGFVLDIEFLKLCCKDSIFWFL
jgi:hypothetical protein